MIVNSQPVSNEFAVAKGGMVELLLRALILLASVLMAMVALVTLATLQGCAGAGATAKVARDIKTDPTAGFFIPVGTFAKKASGLTESTSKLSKIYPSFASSDKAVPFISKVVLYDSLSTRNYLEQGNLDASYGPQIWEVFLKKYNIPYQIATTPAQLQAIASGVLVLPSSVALSMRERQAITDFRARGGSVLSTWLTGVRDEKGAWQGFDFMQTVLDTKVLGDTSGDKDDNFLMPNGDSPISNALPAGRRVWLERAKNWYPLRLEGKQDGAHIMDWSRTFDPEKATTVMVFDERPLGEHKGSRIAVLGYPERLWQSAKPEHLEAINYNALTWLLRLPSVYKAAWPAPYSSAMALTIDAAEVVAAPDMMLAELIESIGARATYYSNAEHAAKSAKNLIELRNRGHELAYMGDAFVGFKGQTSAIQSARLEKMRLRFKDSGLTMPINAGFHAPFESFDKTTESLLLQGGFSYYVAFMDATESRLPFIATSVPAGNGEAQTVVLPRTQRGPEDATEEGDVDDGLKSFFSELTLAQKMGGLSVVRLPTQSLLPIEEWNKVVEDLKNRKEQMWMATGSQIANWWLERERVLLSIEGNANAPELKVEVRGATATKQEIYAFVNLPIADTTLALAVADTQNPSQTMPKTFAIDRWRSGVSLAGLSPGVYRWKIVFKP
jgi:hypothetical protein